MTQRQMDIRRRRLTAVFVLVGLILTVFALAAGTGMSAPGLQPPEVTGSRVDNRVARAGRTAGDSLALSVTDEKARAAVARVARSGQPLFCGGKKPYVALTFDDGPTPKTPQLAKLLRESGVSATFFVLGSKLNDDRSSVDEMKSAGEIANHSWTHSNYTTLGNKELKKELRDTEAVIKSTQGSTPLLARPPYGARDERVNKILAKQKLAEILWSADTQDALNASWQQVASSAIDGIGPGAIVLMHDGQETTLTALKKKILPAARRRKLQFVTLSEFLAVNPPSDEQLEAGPRGCAHAGKRNVTGMFFEPSEQLGYKP